MGLLDFAIHMHEESCIFGRIRARIESCTTLELLNFALHEHQESRNFSFGLVGAFIFYLNFDLKPDMG
jgi:hypothetical protein